MTDHRQEQLKTPLLGGESISQKREELEIFWLDG